MSEGNFDPETVLGPAGGGLLGALNRAGFLAAADVHVARRLVRLGGEPDERVALAAALAVRAPRVGHVLVDVAAAAALAFDADADAGTDAGTGPDSGAPPWPEPKAWLAALVASPLVDAGGAGGAGERPLHLEGTALYLDRYWRDELAVADDLRRRAASAGVEVDETVLAAGLERYFPGAGADQRAAAAVAVRRRLAVVAGGPGTGKTTTVARLLALLHDQAASAGGGPPVVALAAPTGKAAARMEEAVRAESDRLDCAPPVRAWLAGLRGSTLHRLLGTLPGSASRFRHHHGLRLPHDAVVVDEASMVSLALMARLLEAVRPDGRLVVVGDPEQLVSVEAGAVLADIVGPAGGTDPSTGPLAESIAVLHTNHRFGGALAELAAAVRAGDADAALAVLGAGDPAAVWLEQDPTTAPDAALDGVRQRVTDWADRVVGAARDGDAVAALAVLGAHRVLCAHRRGPAGVAAWNARIEQWLAARRPDLAGEGVWYAGRPVLVTANDYALRLFNGDTGVAVPAPGGRVGVAFDGRPALVAPSRLDGVETVHAMTVHKSQGSEFGDVTLLLPPAGSRLLTRELLYTAVTRARRHLEVVATEDALRAAVVTPIARASGLTGRLWPGG